MELIKDTINVCEITAKGTTQAMADGDVIVPDIKPDILKLLQVDSDACITDKYIENGRLVLCGRVDYKVLYVPDSESEKIKSIFTSMEFRQVVDSGGADSDCKILAKPMVERVEFNAVNSRKMRIRAIVHIEYEICRIGITEISRDVEDEEIEKQCRDISFENMVDISEHDFTIKEKLEIPSGENSVNEILKTDIKIYDTEYKSVTGKVIVKGSAGVCVLYTDDDGDVKFVEAELPFTEVLDAEGVSENTICDIDYCVLGTMCEAEPDTDGDLRVLLLDIDVSAALKGTETGEEKILSDCFVPYTKTECVKENIKLRTTAERPSSQNTIREVIEFPQNIPGVNRVYNVMTNAVLTKSELQRNKIICEGKIEANILYLTDSSENPIYSFKKDIPFSYMIECKNNADDVECEIKASVKHISYSLNSGGELEIRCLLSIDCMLIKEISFSNITDIVTDNINSRKGIIIYFANEGESVWNIAKRYSVPCESLVKYNEIEGDKVDRDCKLFIPAS